MDKVEGVNLRGVSGLQRPGNAAPADVREKPVPSSGGTRGAVCGICGGAGTVRDELRGQLCRARPRAWVGAWDKRKQLCVSSLSFLQP